MSNWNTQGADHFGYRDLTYNDWHRPPMIKRYLGARGAFLLGASNIDWVEYDTNERPRRALALIEDARDVGQSEKWTGITQLLAAPRSDPLPVRAVLWTKGDPIESSACPMCRGSGLWTKHDIASFRVSETGRAGSWRTLSPAEWAAELLALRIPVGQTTTKGL